MTYHLTMLVMRTLAILDLNYWVSVSFRLLKANGLVHINIQEGPDTLEFMMVIMNFVIGVPVLLCVGGFRSVSRMTSSCMGY